MRMDSRDRNLLRGMVVAAEVLSLLAFWTQNFADHLSGTGYAGQRPSFLQPYTRQLILRYAFF